MDATRERIFQATYACVARDGLARTTVEAVTQEAGVSRATVYRHFPGGRDDVITATISWEVGRFFATLDRDTAGSTDFAGWLTEMLSAARRRLDEHQVLQHALMAEADQVLPPLVQVMPIVLGMLRDQIAERLASEELVAGVDRGEAAEFVARMMLSHMGSAGCWQLDDPAEARRLVQDKLLAGVLTAHS